MKSKMILQVHDELVFEISKGEEHLVDRIRNIMENIYRFDVPLKVDVSKGENYLEMDKI